MVLPSSEASPDVGPGFENSPSQSGLGGRVRWLPPTTSFTLTKPGSAQRFAAADSTRVKIPFEAAAAPKPQEGLVHRQAGPVHNLVALLGSSFDDGSPAAF